MKTSFDFYKNYSGA